MPLNLNSDVSGLTNSGDVKYDHEPKSQPLHDEKQKNKSPNKMFHVLLSEKYSTLGKELYYAQPPDQDVLVAVVPKNTFAGNTQEGLWKFFQEVFLPQGYPHSVSPDYTQYQIWDTTQAFCSTITGTLATHAVLKGVGVGDSEATPLAATITWIVKEGTGNIGRIAFAWWKGTSLDADSKKWRLIADCLNDAAICLEVALPLFKGFTTPVLCISTTMKSIVSVAGGATRAALTQHQAIRGNFADVAAKDGSQETAVNIIASLVAISIISLVGQNIWPVFFIFTAFHIVANYRGVSSVCLNTFNCTRFLHTTFAFLENEIILPPVTVNLREPVFSKNYITDEAICGFKIKVGSSLKSLVVSGKVILKTLENAIDIFQDSKHLIVFDMHERCIHVVMDGTSSSEDILCGYFNALIFGVVVSAMKKQKLAVLENDGPSSKMSFKSVCKRIIADHADNMDLPGSPISLEVCREVRQLASRQWEHFGEELKTLGWNLGNNLILSQEWRATWKYGAKDENFMTMENVGLHETLRQNT